MSPHLFILILLQSFLNSLYGCKYAEFFRSFVEVVDQMRADPYLSPHIR